MATRKNAARLIKNATEKENTVVEVNEAIGRQKGDKSRSTENHKLEQYGPVPSDLRKYCSRRTDDHPTAYQNHIGHFHIFDDPNPDYTLPLVPARIVRVTPALPEHRAITPSFRLPRFSGTTTDSARNLRGLTVEIPGKSSE